MPAIFRAAEAYMWVAEVQMAQQGLEGVLLEST
jgi:hypothetical protein